MYKYSTKNLYNQVYLVVPRGEIIELLFQDAKKKTLR